VAGGQSHNFGAVAGKVAGGSDGGAAVRKFWVKGGKVAVGKGFREVWKFWVVGGGGISTEGAQEMQKEALAEHGYWMGLTVKPLVALQRRRSRMNAMKPAYAIPIRKRLFFVDSIPSSVQRAQNQ